ncbi:MAG TPA: HAMP domain-containing sensor histidine kinase [Candidatus Acidoferrum sp.]|nr:HAMP domain-containing sensor histidine kinase [Candidatus Acidoferrum sp.]
MVQRINSKIVSKITLLVIIEIILIVGSFGVLSYFQSLQSSIGNSINIAGKNRYLTANLLLQIERYLDGSSDISHINVVMNSLQSNIIGLTEGGSISGVHLRPLPSEFSDLWNTVNAKWNTYRTAISNNLIIPSEEGKANTIDKLTIRKQFNSLALDLIGASDVLVTQLGEQVDKNSYNLLILQITLGILNMGILALILYLITRILRPIFVLTQAMSEVKKGNLEISVQENNKAKDELSILTRSFNLMLDTIRNHNKKQDELTKDLARANEELKQAGRLKDDFINVAAHELRNPVQPILGLAQILRSKKMRKNDSHNKSITIDEEYKLLDIIVRNAKKLLLLEENILDVARIENKSLKLDIEECNLYDVIRSVVQDTRDQIDSSRVELLYDKGEDNIFLIRVDKSRLEQVISNFLSNCIKFTKEGTISLNVEEKDNQALVTVKDTGSGIDPEMLPRVFSKFATKSEKGAGLGLFICKSIIEAHGGRIWAENNSNGKGATFSFTLPC